MPDLKGAIGEDIKVEPTLVELTKDVLATMLPEDAAARVEASKAEWGALVDANVAASEKAEPVEEKPAVVVDRRLREDATVKLSAVDAAYLVEQYKLSCNAGKDAILADVKVDALVEEKRLPVDGIAVVEEPELTAVRDEKTTIEQVRHAAMHAFGARVTEVMRAAGLDGVVIGGWRHDIAEGTITVLKARDERDA